MLEGSERLAQRMGVAIAKVAVASQRLVGRKWTLGQGVGPPVCILANLVASVGISWWSLLVGMEEAVGSLMAISLSPS